jgi:hypothetical protein
MLSLVMEGDVMSGHDRTDDAKALDELEKKIVRVAYDAAPSKRADKSSVDTAKILRLAKKIRETYDYNDPALNGAH